MISMPWLVLLPLVAVLALLVGYFGSRAATARTLGDAETRASRILEDAKRLVDQARADADAKVREADTKVREAEAQIRGADLEAKELVLKVRGELDQESRARQREIQEVERRVLQQEEQLGRRLDQLDRRETDVQTRDRALGERERGLAEKEARLGSALEEQRRKLESIAGLTAEEAKRQLLAQVEVESRREAQLIGMRLEEEARETAHVKAKEVLATTIQRLAPDYTVETAVSIVDLPSDDMKGRIIGREGRNIRALELHTGVDLIVDDTPEAVLISAYDPYRREIARLALQRLIADGRIHPGPHRGSGGEGQAGDGAAPASEEGDKACFEVGVHGLHPELIKLVGPHEVPHVLRPELPPALEGSGLARRHDGGRDRRRRAAGQAHGPAPRHRQGAHPRAGGEPPRAVAAGAHQVQRVAAGHQRGAVRSRERGAETIEAVLTEAADGISAARPGARRDVLESYIKRLAKLEEIALSYKGVELCYAIQAGRELRVMTKAEQISDLDAHQLAKDISKRIEAEMQYPGHIKVVVIRETRAVEVAR